MADVALSICANLPFWVVNEAMLVHHSGPISGINAVPLINTPGTEAGRYRNLNGGLAIPASARLAASHLRVLCRKRCGPFGVRPISAVNLLPFIDTTGREAGRYRNLNTGLAISASALTYR